MKVSGQSVNLLCSHWADRAAAICQRCQDASKRVVSGVGRWHLGMALTFSSHPNLPQLVGYSNDETPTPFILLANGSYDCFILHKLSAITRSHLQYRHACRKLCCSIPSRKLALLVASSFCFSLWVYRASCSLRWLTSIQYRDTLDAALYYQQQLNLSDSKLQDYVEVRSLYDFDWYTVCTQP